MNKQYQDVGSGQVIWHAMGSLLWKRFRNPMMLLILVALFLVMAGLRGFNLNGMGAPFLFWHEDLLVQFAALASLGFFLEEWVYIAFLLDTDPANPNPSVVYFRNPAERRLRTKEELIRAVQVNTIGCTLLLCAVFTVAGIIFQWNLALPNELSYLVSFEIFAGVFIAIFIRVFLMRKVLPNLPSNLKDVLDHRMIKVDDFDTSGFGMGRSEIDSESAQQERQKYDQNVRESLLDFHRLAALKQTCVFAAIGLLCVLHWIPWTKALVFGRLMPSSVAAYACIALTVFTGLYGFLIFHRRRVLFESIVFVCTIVAFLPVIYSQIAGHNLHLAQPIRGMAETDDSEVRDTAQRSVDAIEELIAVAKYQQDELAKGSSPASPENSARSDRFVLENWKNLLGPRWRSGKPPLIVVANSGGGIKAQVWSTVALTAIEHVLSKEPHGNYFPNHVRLVTGTSGGMVGACYWVATVPPIVAQQQWRLDESPNDVIHWAYNGSQLSQRGATPLPREVMVEHMSADALSSVARHLFFDDFLGFPCNALRSSLSLFSLPRKRLLDARGVALERAWEDVTAVTGEAPIQPMGQKFRDLAFGEELGWRPSLALAPTVAEDGRRLLISNLPMEYVLVSDMGKAQGKVTMARAIEQKDAAPSAGSETTSRTPSYTSTNNRRRHSVCGYSVRLMNPQHQIRVSTAARLSANFPLIVDSPAIPLLKEGFRVMDAGYIDNYGLLVATQWIKHNRQWLRENTCGVMLIQLSSSHLEREDTLASEAVALPEVAGFINASFNKTLHREDIAIADLVREFNRTETESESEKPSSESDESPSNFFQFVSIEYEGPASLSWYLTSAEKYSLLAPFLPTQAFCSENFSPNFCKSVFDQGKNVFESKKNAAQPDSTVQRLAQSQVTVQASLDLITEWWRTRAKR